MRSFDDVAGWASSDPRPALRAWLRGPDPAGYEAAHRAAAAFPVFPEAEAARLFVERHFAPVETASDGFLTGYYEPELPASLTREGRFRWPLYAPPADLVQLAPEAGAVAPRFARRTADGAPEPYPTRAEIEAGLLAGQGLEIAWLADPVDAFFVHIQGSARLRLSNGDTLRVGYAAKNGHPFTAIGRVLVARGELALEEADMAGIRRWLAAKPLPEQLALLGENRSFIFFRRVEGIGASEGPIGAAGVPLTPFGSLAVDPLFHPYGSLVFVSAPGFRLGDQPFSSLLAAQDTGSAIRGRARGDLFTGSGDRAGALAGTIRHPCAFTALLPRDTSGHGD